MALDRIKARGRNLRWRLRLAVAFSGLFGTAVLVGAATMLVDGERPAPPTEPAAPPSADESPIPEDPVVSLSPNRVRVGDRVKLRVRRPPGYYGLDWTLERWQESSWELVGYLKTGPGKDWKEEFHFPPKKVFLEDIGFEGSAVMIIEIPKLEPGRYRLRTEFIEIGNQPLRDRTEWHAAEFDVLD